MKWILLLVFCLSCVKDNLSPEAALKSFVESRIDAVVTRESILERVTGKMKQSLENISDEEFAKFADLRHVKKESFRVLSKSCQDKVCYLTYSVSYRTMEGDKTTFSSEVKKIAEVINEKGQWLIADVSNIKTYHEALEPISP
jgi:hypothetical protein